MSYRKKVKAEVSDIVDVQYQNKFAQIASLVGPCRLFGILGRGSAKTTDIQVERLIDIMYDMPGAPCAWVADTFSNLTANVLPAVLEGLERLSRRNTLCHRKRASNIHRQRKGSFARLASPSLLETF